MPVNIFEGSRRVTRLLALIGITIYLGTIAFVFFTAIDDSASPARWTEVGRVAVKGFVAISIWLAFLYGFSWTVGWILRGFLGIPRGQDHKPITPPER